MFGPYDGRRVAVHPYRQMMPFLMRGRNESAVYFEQRLDVTRAQAWLATRRASLFALVLHALASVLRERERLNRFTVGRRTYQRDGVLLSFAAKKRYTDDAPLATVKRRFAPGESFDELVHGLSENIASAKSDARSAVDRELTLLLKLPGFLLAFLLWVFERLYARGLAPRSLVESDPMYASAFVANLGSLGVDAAYHHLYEHGNCPLFVTIGRVVDGKLTIRYTFDERVEDGLYCAHSLQLFAQRVEDPASWIDSRE
jgi:hypothetical protein